MPAVVVAPLRTMLAVVAIPLRTMPAVGAVAVVTLANAGFGALAAAVAGSAALVASVTTLAVTVTAASNQNRFATGAAGEEAPRPVANREDLSGVPGFSCTTRIERAGSERRRVIAAANGSSSGM